MAQLNSPLTPNQNRENENKKGFPWALIAFFVLVIGGPFGILLAAIAVVVILIVKMTKNGVDLGKGQRPSFKSEQPSQYSTEAARKRPPTPSGHRTDRPQMRQEHVHGSLTDHCRAQRLKQLETLKEAGLYDEEEYKAKKRQIIRETANEK